MSWRYINSVASISFKLYLKFSTIYNSDNGDVFHFVNCNNRKNCCLAMIVSLCLSSQSPLAADCDGSDLVLNHRRKYLEA